MMILKEVILGSLITIGLFVSGVFAFFTPTPVLYLMLSQKRAQGFWVGFISFLVVAVFNTYRSSWMAPDIYYIAYYIAIGLLLGEGLLRRWPISKWFAVAVGIPWILAVAGYLTGEYVWGITSVIKTHFNGMFGELQKIYEASDAVRTTVLSAHKDEIINFMVWILPSMAWLFALGTGCLNVLLTKRICKDPSKFAHLGKVSAWRTPEMFVWVAISCGASYFINEYFFKTEMVKYIAINGLIISASLYFLHGVFIIAYFLEGKASFFIKLLVVGVIVFFFQMVGLIIVAMGFADIWLDFRKLGKKMA